MRRGGRVTRADANYKEVRRRIVRIQKRNEQTPIIEETYVDAYRSLAVQLGTATDLKAVMNRGGPGQGRVQAQSRVDEGEEGRDQMTFVKQAKHLMQRGQVGHALKLIHTALNLAPEDPIVRTVEAQCLLQMGAWEPASASADAVLAANPAGVRALLVKAEALYNTCCFEHALLLFHRGMTLAPDWEGFRLGVHKCRETIETTVAHAPSIKEPGMESFLREMADLINDELEANANTDNFDTESIDNNEEGIKNDKKIGFENQKNFNFEDEKKEDSIEAKIDTEKQLNTSIINKGKTGRSDRLQQDKSYLSSLEDHFRGSDKGVSDLLQLLGSRNDFWSQVEDNKGSRSNASRVYNRLDFKQLREQGLVR